jgi:hypothetical protein
MESHAKWPLSLLKAGEGTMLYAVRVGIHNPAWVQAVAAVVLVALTFVTLIYLRNYVRDTHTLAKTSVEQISLVKKQNAFDAMLRTQTAFDTVFKANDDLREILQSVIDGTFGTEPQPSIYPQNWPEVTSAFIQYRSDMAHPAISCGVCLRAVDLAVRAYSRASNADAKQVRLKELHKSLDSAATACKGLLDAMKEFGGQ